MIHATLAATTKTLSTLGSSPDRRRGSRPAAATGRRGSRPTRSHGVEVREEQHQFAGRWSWPIGVPGGSSAGCRRGAH
jgi:hypothetical protein